MSLALYVVDLECVCVCVDVQQPITANYLTAGPAHYAAVPVLPAGLTPAAAAAYAPIQTG